MMGYGVAGRSWVGVCLVLLMSFAAPAVPAMAASPGAGVQIGKSGLPLPRFVSLKSSRVNVRVGPGDDYKISWVFTRPDLPVEIVQEFDNWRRIRDADGSMGWVFHSLLSGKRTATVSPWGEGEPRPIRASASESARVTAYLQPGVTATVDECTGQWCRLSGRGFRGWIEQELLWGVYINEVFD